MKFTAFSGVFILLFVLNVQAKPSKEGKITGGTPAAPGEFPYTVSIRSPLYGHTCGGAIISPNLVVTAAICVPGNTYTILAGSLNRIEPIENSTTEQIRVPTRSIKYPDFGGISPINDIGLIFLDEPFEFNDYVNAISLPEVNQSTYPNPVIASGWGNIQYGEPLSDVMMKVTMDTYSDEECETFMNQEVVGNNLLCTGTDQGGLSTCQGDAGAPVASSVGDLYLAAIISHFPCSEACCGFPGPMDHNPEIAQYVDWIRSQSELYGGGL